MTDHYDVDVFGAKIRLNTKNGTYQKTDGTTGESKQGISISIGSGWIRPTPLQMAGILQAFQAGTDLRKELIKLVELQKKEQEAIRL